MITTSVYVPLKEVVIVQIAIILDILSMKPRFWASKLSLEERLESGKGQALEGAFATFSGCHPI